MNDSRPGPARCVLLFARAPRAEAAAKGLCQGEALFTLARNRVVQAVAALPDVELVFVPPAAQSGENFGERLESAFREAALRGYGEIVAVPGDVPALATRDLDAAFRALSGSDTVLGPSRDGGVWLIGLRAGTVSLSDFFEGVPWLTSRVLGALVSNAPGSAVLSERGDVDLRADALRMLRAARVALDSDLVAALGILLGVSPSIRAAGASFAALAPLSLPLHSRAPPLLLLSF
jgi:glycosyltransferase A (GT-A) superfamily protein (DUF2064 family)